MTNSLREAAQALCVELDLYWNDESQQGKRPPDSYIDRITQAELAVLDALAAPEPEGDGRHVCPDCKNTFLQPFVCTTCGAQKLYDNTVLNLSNANEELRARCERMEAALEAGRVLEKALHACITNEEVEIKGTSLGADIVAHALNTFHKLADALRGK